MKAKRSASKARQKKKKAREEMSKKECEDIFRKLGFSPAPTDVTTLDTSTTTPRSNFNTEVTPVRPRTQANQTDDTSTSYINEISVFDDIYLDSLTPRTSTPDNVHSCHSIISGIYLFLITGHP